MTNAEKLQGTILVSHGNRGVVEFDGGERAEVQYRRSVGRPYCGDRVRVGYSANDGVVEEILPRKNVFARADARRRKQVIAANLDQVLIVIAPAPAPSTDLVERYLVAVHSLGITPLLVVNKAELLTTAEKESDGPLGRLPVYSELGYRVLQTSCKGPPGTGALQPVLAGQTSILVGQSGVGKSSLVNTLLPDHDLQTGELSRATGKGTHTTTTTILYKLPGDGPGGGQLIDSPGVWEYGLWDLEQEELASGYIEFRPCLGHCRFNDCRHAGEPDCAVAAAVEQGSIHRWRYDSYLRLLVQSG
jgi:ribosome biogenesis GTPase